MPVCKAEDVRPWPKEEPADLGYDTINREPIRDGDGQEASPSDGALETGGALTDEASKSHGAEGQPGCSDAMQNKEDGASFIGPPADPHPSNTTVTVTGVAVTRVAVTGVTVTGVSMIRESRDKRDR